MKQIKILNEVVFILNLICIAVVNVLMIWNFEAVLVQVLLTNVLIFIVCMTIHGLLKFEKEKENNNDTTTSNN